MLVTSRSLRAALRALAFSCVVACSGNTAPPDGGSTEDGGGDAADVDAAAPVEVALTGVVQKGPFVLGTSVSVAVLDDALAPIGTSFATQTDAVGSFALQNVPPAPLAIEATGSYYNEVTGALSDGVLTLRALFLPVDAATQAVNVNLLTHLTAQRIRARVIAGDAFDVARERAESDLATAMAITADGLLVPRASDLRVDAPGLGNAYLLGVSSVVLRAAQRRAVAQGGGLNAHVQELLNTIAVDLEADGELAQALRDELRGALRTLDIEQIETDLAARLQVLGVSTTLPDMRAALDTDGDGHADGDDGCPYAPDADQADEDEDGVGDRCDPCPRDACRIDAVANAFVCDIRSGRVVCNGTDAAAASLPPPMPAGVVMETVSAAVVQDGGARTLSACGIRSDGELVCWGSPLPGGAPVLPQPARVRAAHVSVYETHACVVYANGALRCWGDTTHGATTPPELPDGERWWYVRTYLRGACGIATDGMHCWGDADDAPQPVLGPDEYVLGIYGESDGALVARTSTGTLVASHASFLPPTSPSAAPWREIVPATRCGLRADGVIACWSGQGMEDAVPAGSYSGLAGRCAIAEDGRTVCWGTRAHEPVTDEQFAAGVRVLDVDATHRNLCVRTSLDELFCARSAASPISTLPTLPTGVTWGRVVARPTTACALRSDGLPFCQPSANDEVTVPDTAFRDLEVVVSQKQGSYFQAWSALGVRADGTLAVLKDDGDFAVDGPSTLTSIRIGADQLPGDQGIACGLEGALGRPFIFGYDVMLGSSWASMANPAFQAEPPAGVSWTQVDCGVGIACGLRSDGELRCVDATDLVPDEAHGPALPLGVTWTRVAALYEGMCGLRSDGVISCFGTRAGRWENMGELRARPGESFTRIESGGATLCAFDTSGRLECWGEQAVHPY